MERVYLLRYIDKETGFFRHEEYTKYRDAMARKAELISKGAIDVRLMPTVVGRGGGP